MEKSPAKPRGSWSPHAGGNAGALAGAAYVFVGSFVPALFLGEGLLLPGTSSDGPLEVLVLSGVASCILAPFGALFGYPIGVFAANRRSLSRAALIGIPCSIAVCGVLVFCHERLSQDPFSSTWRSLFCFFASFGAFAGGIAWRTVDRTRCAKTIEAKQFSIAEALWIMGVLAAYLAGWAAALEGENN